MSCVHPDLCYNQIFTLMLTLVFPLMSLTGYWDSATRSPTSSGISKNPEGTLSRLEGRIKALEDHRAGNAIECSRKTLCDLGSLAIWLQTFQDKNLYRYCVDMVTLIMLCAEAYETIAEGMAMAAAAHKAEYNSLTKA
jgi:hypothetical protein